MKHCEFCNRLNPPEALLCELCRKRFPLKKLTFGTKSECWKRLIFWSVINLTMPPVLVAILFILFPPLSFVAVLLPTGAGGFTFPLAYFYAFVLWTGFVGIVMLFRWFMSDGESVADVHNRMPQVTGHERYRGIGLELMTQTVMAPFNRMMDAYSDLRRHY